MLVSALSVDAAAALSLPVETLPDNLNYSFCYMRLSQRSTNCSVNLIVFRCFILVSERTKMITEVAQLCNMGHQLSSHNFCNKAFCLKTVLSIKINIKNGETFIDILPVFKKIRIFLVPFAVR